MNKTVKDFVVEDFRTAAVFEQHGIDFCCGGGVTLEEACARKGIEAEAVRRELEELASAPAGMNPRFERWELDALVEHIVTSHHAFVKGAIPVLMAHTAKVASVHGGRHPEVVEIYELMRAVAEEMTSHMQKEELMLFPYIKALAKSMREGTEPPRAPFGSVANPIRMMESEHSSAGGAMERIRELTNGFRPPEDACTTYRVSFQELAQFERDLHVHVHLENNILFPRAIEMEGAVVGA
jgi:regulator of cell morphogenesis and NO signaling